MPQIHPSAIVHPKAQLADDVVIGPGAVVEEKVVIGPGCQIGPYAILYNYVELGARCRVHAHAVLGDVPQDLGFKEVPSHVRIGSDCVLREGVTIHRPTKEGGATVVGDHCFLMAYSHLAHDVVLGPRVIMANNVMVAGHVHIGERCFIGGGVAIHQFCTIGRLCMMGGNSGISKDMPPFCISRGVTSNAVSGLNAVGLKRAGFSPEERLQIKRAFKLLYLSGLNISQALERMREEIPSGPGLEFIAFLERPSNRGLCAYEKDLGED